jgi:hypothetical protein
VNGEKLIDRRGGARLEMGAGIRHGLRLILAALLLTGAGALRAETLALNPRTLHEIPDGTSFILGLELRGTTIMLITTNETYSAPMVAQGASLFTKILDASGFIEGITEESAVAINPTDLTTITFTNFTAFQPSISTVQIEAPFWVYGNPSPTEETLGRIEYDSTGALYFFTPQTGFLKYASGSNPPPPRSGEYGEHDGYFTAPILSFGTSGPGQITSPTNGFTVSGNTLYAYDPDKSRVVMFDTQSGGYLGDFAVSDGWAGSAIAVSLDGRLFLSHGDGTAGAYSLATGETVYTLISPLLNYQFHHGRDSLAFDDALNQLFFFDEVNRSVHEYDLPAYTPVPEPSTYAIGIAALLGGIVLLRRRNFSRK